MILYKVVGLMSSEEEKSHDKRAKGLAHEIRIHRSRAALRRDDNREASKKPYPIACRTRGEVKRAALPRAQFKRRRLSGAPSDQDGANVDR